MRSRRARQPGWFFSFGLLLGWRDQRHNHERENAAAICLIPHSSFCEEVFSSRPAHAAARMRAGWATVLAPGIRRIFEKIRAPFYRLHRECAIGHWEIVSSYSSATAPGLHGISCVSSLIQ